jgi:Telomere repeat binding factor (TRF)
MGQPTRDQALILSDLFPSTEQLTQHFVSRRSTSPLQTTPTQDDLTPTEIEFITKCERRKEVLRSLGDSDKAVQELRDTYSWEAFLRELRGYVAKNWEIIVGSKGGKPRRPVKRRPAALTGDDAMGGITEGFTGPVPHDPTQDMPSALPVSENNGPSIWEAYEKARLMSLPTPAGPAGSTMGTPATGIPTPSTAAANTTPQIAQKTTSDGSQVRRPWTKEEGIISFLRQD